MGERSQVAGRASEPLRGIAAFAPYVAVLLGLYALRSAWAAILGYHVLMVTAIHIGGGWRTRERLLVGWRNGFGIAALVVCALAGPALAVAWPYVHPDGFALGEVLEALGLAGLSWWVFMAYYTLVNPWLEEAFWRGFLGSDAKGPVATDVLFAGYHIVVLLRFVGIEWALLCAAALSFAAWAWRQLARETDGLLVPCASHLVADLSIIVTAHVLSAT